MKVYMIQDAMLYQLPGVYCCSLSFGVFFHSNERLATCIANTDSKDDCGSTKTVIIPYVFQRRLLPINYHIVRDSNIPRHLC